MKEAKINDRAINAIECEINWCNKWAYLEAVKSKHLHADSGPSGREPDVERHGGDARLDGTHKSRVASRLPSHLAERVIGQLLRDKQLASVGQVELPVSVALQELARLRWRNKGGARAIDMHDRKKERWRRS